MFNRMVLVSFLVLGACASGEMLATEKAPVETGKDKDQEKPGKPDTKEPVVVNPTPVEKPAVTEPAPVVTPDAGTPSNTGGSTAPTNMGSGGASGSGGSPVVVEPTPMPEPTPVTPPEMTPPTPSMPKIGDPCTKESFKQTCTDPRFLLICDLVTHKVKARDCAYEANLPSKGLSPTYLSCQTAISGGKEIDLCQCAAGDYICRANPCGTENCDKPNKVFVCNVSPKVSGDTTTGMVEFTTCPSQTYCAESWRGAHTKAAPLTCRSY